MSEYPSKAAQEWIWSHVWKDKFKKAEEVLNAYREAEEGMRDCIQDRDIGERICNDCLRLLVKAKKLREEFEKGG